MSNGHPAGLYPLFFTEMWERLAFYMLLGILVLYASDVQRGGLGLTGEEASAIYGTYLAFVYFTPFLGGMLADRYLGYRRSVLIGGLFMASGLFLLGMPGLGYFYAGLVCLCVGNGFFKPNISAMVGNLYEPGDPKRDIGFNIFYMGINIGAAIANLVAAPLRNKISWQAAFSVAGVGILIGLAVLLANWRKLARADHAPGARGDNGVSTGLVFGKILLPAAFIGAGGYYVASSVPGFPLTPSMFGFLCGMLPILAFLVRLATTAPPDEKPGLMALLPVFVAGGTFFMILHLNGSALTVWARDTTQRQVSWVPELWKQKALAKYFATAAPAVPRPDRRTLLVTGELPAKMFGAKKLPQSVLEKLAAQPGVRALTVWQPGQQQDPAGVTELQKELATFVYADDKVEVAGSEFALRPGAKPSSQVALVRDLGGAAIPVLPVTQKTFDAVYAKAGAETATLAPGEFLHVVSPEVYQAWNPLFVILLTPLVIAFFAAMTRRGRQISTARKIFFGMLLTAGAMLIMALAGYLSNEGESRVMGLWLVSAYAVVTVGELCLSPMGLSLVTKLAPKRLVGLMMGGWFVATSFGNKLSGFFGEIQDQLAPTTFFLILTGCALAVAVFLFTLLPKLDATIQRYERRQAPGR